MSLKDKLSVLVVDDMSTSRGLITQSLEKIGISNYRVEADAEKAWRGLASKPVHLIISDYNMPKMNGLQFLTAIRSNKQTSRIAFILVTGRPEQQIIDHGIRLGMNNYLKKPFSETQMKACLERVVGKL